MKRVKYLLLVLCLLSLTGCKKSNEKVQEFYLDIFENNRSYVNANKKSEFISHYTDQGYSIKEYAFVDYGDDNVTDVVVRLTAPIDNVDLEDIGLILTYQGSKVYGHEVDGDSINSLTSDGVSFFHTDDESGWKTYIIDKTKIEDKIIYSKTFGDNPTCIEQTEEISSCDTYDEDVDAYVAKLSYDIDWVTYGA